MAARRIAVIGGGIAGLAAGFYIRRRFGDNVELKIYNPSDIPLYANNLVCTFSRLDGDKTTLLAKKDMDPCEITAKHTICVKTELRIPYLTYLFSGSKKLLPDWIILNIVGDFSIAGTRQVFPISINAYF